MESFLLQLFILFAASAIAVPIAKKIGLGSVIGYLFAGIIIGPFGLSLIGDVESVMHFTEFGVVMMLFLVGLELKPSLLWKMRSPILGMGGAQVVLSAAILGFVACIFLPWKQGLAIGLILALSSTAIVIQTLREKGFMKTVPGRAVFSVLLFQDLAVIPMLAFMPFLAMKNTYEVEQGEGLLIDIGVLPGYLQLIIIMFVIVAVYFLGKYASKPIFRIIAETRVREIFVAAALAMVVGISLLMTAIGLSPALGTFLAGVVLADSEYRHELESDIEPFKGLLLGVFFISIGASLNFILIGNKLSMIAGITIGLILLKFVVLYFVARLFKLTKKDRSFFAITLAQGGEFAFVLFQFTRTNGILESGIVEPLIASVAISMFLAPILFKVHEKMMAGKEVEEQQDRENDQINKKGHRVILAGFGRLGTDIGRFLLSAGVKVVILDHNAQNVDMLRKFGFEVYYGDVTRLELLEAAGVSEAELIIITLSDIEISKKMIELIKKHYPHLKIVANALDMPSVYELKDMKVERVRKETFGTALTMGQDALGQLGMDPYEAYRLKRIFRKHNDDMIEELHEKHHEDFESYAFAYHEKMADVEELMELDMELYAEEIDKVWTESNQEE